MSVRTAIEYVVFSIHSYWIIDAVQSQLTDSTRQSLWYIWLILLLFSSHRQFSFILTKSVNMVCYFLRHRRLQTTTRHIGPFKNHQPLIYFYYVFILFLICVIGDVSKIQTKDDDNKTFLSNMSLRQLSLLREFNTMLTISLIHTLKYISGDIWSILWQCVIKPTKT